ncbi:MAG TPA: ACP S-malonyltransferase [Afifellaceae bacterium]|nr:ACP S-malonyltransferase [Afifellaceae bacterium]
MSNAFIFPGQGSQSVGMGQDIAEAFPEARAVFDEVDDALDEKLSELIWNGSESDINLTRNTQPALMAVSLAILRAMEARGVSVGTHAAYVAGHSLGEYSALAAAGSIGIGETARLLRIRGEAMQQAVPVGEGAMAAILGLELDEVSEVAKKAAQGEVCQAANDNAPGQVVVSGARSAVERAVDIAKARGARRAILLPVSAPFHCALMAPAAELMADALANTEIAKPAVPLVANVLAEAIDDPARIRKHLVEQVTGSVRWRESVTWMAANGVDRFVEIGAGKVLTGLTRRIVSEATGISVAKAEDIDAAVAEIVG